MTFAFSWLIYACAHKLEVDQFQDNDKSYSIKIIPNSYPQIIHARSEDSKIRNTLSDFLDPMAFILMYAPVFIIKKYPYTQECHFPKS
jgi:hypothetical protein